MNGITIVNGTLPDSVVNEYVALEERMKADKKRMDDIKAALMEAMKEKEIVKIENDAIRVNYIAAVERETFDAKQFRADNPDLYDAYVRLTTTAPSLRIAIK